jgi:hypothetical protein
MCNGTTFRTWQTFEIKNNLPLWGENCKTRLNIQKTLNQDHIKFRRREITQKKAYNKGVLIKLLSFPSSFEI